MKPSCKWLAALILVVLLIGGHRVSQATNPKDPYGMGAYYSQVRKEIDAQWTNPSVQTKCSVSAKLQIYKNGRLGGVSPSRSYCSAEIVQAVVDAIKKAAPFQPLPKAYPKDSVVMTLSMELLPSPYSKQREGQKQDPNATDYTKHIDPFQVAYPGGTVYYYIDDPYDQAFWTQFDLPDKMKNEIVPAAFQAWQQALGGCLGIAQTQNPNNARIRVMWANNFDDKAHIGYTQGGRQIAIHMAITRSGRHLNINEIKTLALHEAGHALGIGGHSPYLSDIMYYSTQSSAQRLSPRDVATIRQIYCH